MATAVVMVQLVLDAGPASAQSKAQPAPNGHEIAQRFAEEAERVRQLEAEKARRLEAERKAAAQRRAEAERRAAERQEAERRRQEEAQRAWEADLQARARAEAAERRAAEERRLAEEQRRREEETARAEAERRAAEARRLAEEQRRRDEETARAEAEGRAAEERRLAEEQRRRDEETARAEAERRAAEERRLAEEQRRRDEETARAEAERRAAEARRLAEEQRRREEETARAEAERRAAEARRLAEEQRRRDEETARAEAERRAAEARRLAEEQRRRDEEQALADEEIERVTERLRRIREQHATRRAPPAATGPDDRDRPAVAPVSPSPSATPPARHVEARGRQWPHDTQDRAPAGPGGYSPPLPDDRGHEPAAGRVTILLVMSPGNRGIRRHNPTADPLLCVEDGCYASNGPTVPATLLPRYRALGPGTTFGARAHACSNSLGCVFRDVDLRHLPAVVQPVDLRVMKHDLRQPQRIDTPSACGVRAGRLSCAGAVHGPDYIMWVLPERLAAQLPPALLIDAVRDGLTASDQAGLQPRW